MLKNILPVICLLFFVSCAEKKESAIDISNGQKIFSVNCTSCHGIDGKKGLAGAKDLSKSALSKSEMATIIRLGKGNMTGYGDLLSKEEIDQVISYIITLRK